METNDEELTKQEFEDFSKLYRNLMRAIADNDFGMRLPAFIASLAYFLSEMSEIAVKFGFNKDNFIEMLATATKRVNERKERKKNK
nr:MAG TPA: hypothetical protein [Crassvirales sp.]